MFPHNQDVNQDAMCPFCRGVVNLPKEVKWNTVLKIYRPLGTCTKCLRGYSWHSEKNPVRGFSSVYNGMVDVWFSDRPLQAPAPKVNDAE